MRALSLQAQNDRTPVDSAHQMNLSGFSPDVTHPHFKRVFRGLMSLGCRSNRPADVNPAVWRCHCGPERHVSTKCFLFTSCRGAIYPCASYEITTLAALLQN